jgi:hypothetical protein
MNDSSSALDAQRAADEALTSATWWHDLTNVAKAARYMADQGDYTVEEIAYLVEKPWKHGDVYRLARWGQ